MTSERKLVLDDRIYGEGHVENAIVFDIINSPTFQRLKGLNQYGIPDEFYHLKNFSRYEHSLGVFLLLRHLGASEEEQIAGLLHDVSHKAFSHVYDWVVGSAKYEDAQDKSHTQHIQNSEIATILIAHGHIVERITSYQRFGLLERSSPDLCADRVDYALREFESDLANEIFNGLTVYGGQIVCIDRRIAAKFAKAFLWLQRNHWGGYEAVTRYHIFSSVLKRALEKGIIQRTDFLEDDEHIVDKLKGSRDEEVLKRLDYLREKPLPVVSKGIIVYKKFRYIDPPFVHRGALSRLSKVDKEFEKELENAREENLKGVLVPN